MKNFPKIKVGDLVQIIDVPDFVGKVGMVIENIQTSLSPTNIWNVLLHEGKVNFHVLDLKVLTEEDINGNK